LTALSVKYIRELWMPLVPRASKGTDGQYSEPLVNGIVVGGTDKHATNARTLIEGIGMVNTHDVAVKRELQSANKFLTIIGKHLAASIRCLNLSCFPILRHPRPILWSVRYSSLKTRYLLASFCNTMSYKSFCLLSICKITDFVRWLLGIL
jgi:hypothetical protein